MITTVLFDLDRTLLDRDAMFEAYAAWILEKLSPDKETAKRLLPGLLERNDQGYGDKHDMYDPIIEELSLDMTIEDFIHEWADYTRTHSIEYPDTRWVLEMLAKSYRIGLITNGETEIQWAKIRGSELESYFDTIVVSEDIGIEKPEVGIFLEACQRLAISPKEAVYVGDHFQKDVLGARGAGLQAIWLKRDPEAHDGYASVSSLTELLTVLKPGWAEELSDWFEAVKRPLPWRTEKDPYKIWISEIMLQQTRIETVIGYFERFMKRFPTLEALAEAPEEDLLKCWEGLGYYNRARNLKKAAMMIRDEFQGVFPTQYEDVIRLPGIGEYTAGAILSIAYDQPVPAVDGNVLRVIARLYEITSDVMKDKTRKEVRQLVQESFPRGRAGSFTQGLMELGERVCLPANPVCEQCPIHSFCSAAFHQRQQELPVRSKPNKVKKEERLLYLIRMAGTNRFAMRKRNDAGLLAGSWEYPNHVMGEIPDFALLIENQEPKVQLEYIHKFSHIHWKVSVVETILTNELLPEGYFWKDPEQMEDLMIATAFKPVQNLLKEKTSY